MDYLFHTQLVIEARELRLVQDFLIFSSTLDLRTSILWTYLRVGVEPLFLVAWFICFENCAREPVPGLNLGQLYRHQLYRHRVGQ